ncbi:unnamed protein product [Ectocarpus sp. CCAP 1310/34]|nr:unnamed protein product [Ectocarpus sp. CCAP 1310/34]
MECFAVNVQDPQGMLTKALLVYPGISGRDVQQALRAAFSLPDKVAGLVDPSLDTYFPVSFISRAPKYFSERAPCRIVPVLGGTAKQGRATGSKDNMEASESGRKDTLENILQELFSADAAAPNTTVNTGLAVLRRRLRLVAFPADKVLDALCATAASDGQLTRSVPDR